MVVPPAWSCMPSMVMRHCQIATMPVTTPTRSPALSSCVPCSICISKKPLWRPGSSCDARQAGQARRGQRVAQRRAVVAAAAAVDLCLGQLADDGFAAEEAALEMSFLIGEGADIHRQPGARQRHPGHHAERAIQPARLVLAFDMAADEQVRPGPRCRPRTLPMPSIAGLEPALLEPRHQPAAAFHVLRRIGRPVHAGPVVADLPQLVQVLQEAVGIDRRRHGGGLSWRGGSGRRGCRRPGLASSPRFVVGSRNASGGAQHGMARIFSYPAMERVHMGAAVRRSRRGGSGARRRQARLPHAGRHHLARNGLGGAAGTAPVRLRSGAGRALGPHGAAHAAAGRGRGHAGGARGRGRPGGDARRRLGHGRRQDGADVPRQRRGGGGAARPADERVRRRTRRSSRRRRRRRRRRSACRPPCRPATSPPPPAPPTRRAA